MFYSIIISYLDAAGTIIGIKLLKKYSTGQRNQIVETVGNDIKSIVEQTGKPIHEVANAIGNQLKTSNIGSGSKGLFNTSLSLR